MMNLEGWSLPDERGIGQEPSPDLLNRRAGALAMRDGAAVPEPVEVAGVPCVTCGPDDAASTMLYLHGGGYRMGDPRLWLGLASRISEASGHRLVLPDYRLAPEHPFPAALHDAVSVYGALLDEGSGVPSVGGDSAGGGLAAAVAVVCGSSGRPMPASLVLLSRWLDLTAAGESYAVNAATDEFFSAEGADEAAAAYLQGHDAADPLVSPLLADVSVFPPVMVMAGGSEVLLDDTVAFAGRLQAAGRPVRSMVVPGMQHVWPMMFPHLDESEAAVAAIGEFLGASR